MGDNERIKQLESDIAFLTGEIADIRRNLARLRKAPSVYTTYPEYDREEQPTSQLAGRSVN
jgi:hypothetical protein